MSYANGTTHYNLPQTVGTDKRDWFDTNQAFSDIDAAIYGAVQSASQSASAITALTTRVGTNETNIADLQTSRTTDEAKISALETLTAQHTTDIAGVKADALDMICAVDEGTAQVASVAVEEGEYFRYNDVLYIATADIAVGDTIVPNTNCRATNVATELESGNKAIIFETKTATLASIATGAPLTVQVDCNKSGYTCEGCVSFDAGNSRLLISECNVRSNILYFRVYNVSDSTIENITMNFNMIYSAN